MLRSRRKRGVEACQRRRKLIELAEHHTANIEGVRIFRPDRKRPVERGKRLVTAPEPQQGRPAVGERPEIMQRLEMMRVRGQDRFVERLGLRQLAALMRGHGLAELGRNVVSVRFHLNVSRSPEGWATATYRAARGQNRAAPLPT